MKPEGERKGVFAERLKQACISHYGREHEIVSRLADDVGVSLQASSKWLRGETMPKVEYWSVIAAKLGVTSQWLIGATHEAPGHLADIPDESLELASCRVPDDQMNYRSYPLLASRELLQQFIREQVHGHQAA